MKAFKIDDIAKYTDRPGFTGTFVHSEHMTLTHWVIRKGSPLAPHSHPHEQISFVLSGRLRFDTPQGPVDLLPGEGMVFPGGEEHGGIALEDTVVLDAFNPVREDFRTAMGNEIKNKTEAAK